MILVFCLVLSMPDLLFKGRISVVQLRQSLRALGFLTLLVLRCLRPNFGLIWCLIYQRLLCICTVNVYLCELLKLGGLHHVIPNIVTLHLNQINLFSLFNLTWIGIMLRNGYRIQTDSPNNFLLLFSLTLWHLLLGGGVFVRTRVWLLICDKIERKNDWLLLYFSRCGTHGLSIIFVTVHKKHFI